MSHTPDRTTTQDRIEGLRVLADAAPLLTLERVRAIAAQIAFRDWELRTGFMGDGFFLQWRFLEADNTNAADPTPQLQGCRKWYVSAHATESEVINTAYAAVQMAMSHEVMEQFTVGGKVLYNPHQSVQALLAAELPNDSRQNRDLSASDGTEPR